ncbi:MAG: type II toxin-antitoxin system VapC family toxin [Clostridium sp.]|nr:type II toxin-antitoxin system VapC family toxin [Clostridium sp.]
MKILLDTTLLLWALTNDRRLPDRARRMIENEKNEVYYSVISLWEVQRIHLMRKKEGIPGAADVASYCEEAGFRKLGITEAQAAGADSLFFEGKKHPGRSVLLWMMAAQAAEEDMIFLSAEEDVQDAEDPRICFAGENRRKG